MAMHPEYDIQFKLAFFGEWFDVESAFEKKFIVNFFPADETVELFDIDTNRIFLKRTLCLTLKLRDLFIGNFVLIFGRHIKITGFADCRTKDYLGSAREHTILIIKPSIIDKMGDIINRLEDEQFQVANMKMVKLNVQQAYEFYKKFHGQGVLPFMVEHLCSGPVVTLELIGNNAVNSLLELLGPNNPEEARKTKSSSLRAIYGVTEITNGFYASESLDEAANDCEFWFSPNKDKSPFPELTLTNTTCCIIKPHAIREGKLGCMLNDIVRSKFKILCMQTFNLTLLQVDEYLEVYKEVITDYNALQLGFLNGISLIMEIGAKDDNVEDVHGEFRKFVGPYDPDIGRQIRPTTLRAKYGVDKFKNAVHCTDLPGDTNMDLEYFFKILVG